MKGSAFDRVFRAIWSFVCIFLLSAFLISCCLTLFITTLQNTMGVTFTEDDISVAAKLTMLNVIALSLVFAVIDLVRRRLAVRRPVKRISEATERMIAGDFSVRISPVSKLAYDESFNEVISCINKMAQELSGVETLRSDFTANVSHEMKTPLAVIKNYGALLESPGLTDAERLEYADAIIAAADRLSDMMTNILRLDRLENQQIFPNLRTYDLGEQLCESLLDYESVWESKGIEIETLIEDGVSVSADAELLSLVWSNLLSNAFKFTERGGRVTLRLVSDGEYAVVTVKDTGCGMSPEVGRHIFERFYQGDTSHATQGNGLGLALVKRVVDITHGEITVDSREGEGTEFTVRIRRLTDEGKEDR